MSVSGSPFCEHKKLRTSCAQCKSAALPVDTTMKVIPYVSQDERDKAAQKRERRSAPASAPREEGPPHVDTEPKVARPTGPGKPLLPSRRPKKKGISADEAASATAWWVKK